MLLAAIYARKSTDQNVADEEKSVTLQVQHARVYAMRKGWQAAEEHIYTDDGISGAELIKRPGFLRLMNSIKPRPAFQVLIMSRSPASAASRSRRPTRSSRSWQPLCASGSTSRTGNGPSTPRWTRSCCP